METSKEYSLLTTHYLQAADFPVADVYYWWPSDAGGQNELWLLLVARALRQQVRGRHACIHCCACIHC